MKPIPLNEETTAIARRVIWFEPPPDALQDPVRYSYGRHTVFPAAMGIDRPWKLKAEHHSPRYTTRLSDVPVVRA